MPLSNYERVERESDRPTTRQNRARVRSVRCPEKTSLLLELNDAKVEILKLDIRKADIADVRARIILDWAFPYQLR